MKTKKLEKKMELGKTTIANLDNREMHMVRVGDGPGVGSIRVDYNCPSSTFAP